jgi:hypothetical protein
MKTTQAHGAGPFDPTLAMARDRARVLELEAHHERLAAHGRPAGGPSARTRLGHALIALGSTLVAPAGTRQPSLTD